jgi:hypothetical protein
MGRAFCFVWVPLLAACEVLPPDLTPPRDASAVATFDAAPIAAFDAGAPLVPFVDAGPPAQPDAALPLEAGAGGEGGAGTALNPGCSFVAWPSPDVPPAYHVCSIGQWTGCTCNGVVVGAPPTDAANCLHTLATTCRVDVNARSGCEHAYGGACWPSATAADAWLCECRPGEPRTEVRGASCRAAGDALCRPPPTPCEDKTGRCTPTADGRFSCQCPIDFPMQHIVGADLCFKALRVACVGSLGTATSGEDCMTESFARNQPPSAACFGKGRAAIDGFECQCDTGDGNLRQDKVVAPSCHAALAYHCPEAAPLVRDE